jgi:DNA-binding MarR family transcriptional regulator
VIHRDPDITRLLDRLKGLGLVVRSRGKTDRRVIRARIPAEGFELLKRLDRPIGDFMQGLLGQPGAQRWRALIQLLEDARRSPAA